MATPCEIQVINSLYAIRITGCVVTRIVVSITAYGGDAMYLCVAMVILAFVSGNSLALSNDSKLLIKCIVNATTCDHNKNDFSFGVYNISPPDVTSLNTILITSDYLAFFYTYKSPDPSHCWKIASSLIFLRTKLIFLRTK